jgi:hypothetical protein
MATQRQLEACRRNGRPTSSRRAGLRRPGLGGPKTAEGKAVSRLNARKHGIFALALTDEDAEEMEGLYSELAACLAPAGAVEEMLVEKLAHTYLRLQRCARAEAECHVKIWEAKADSVSLRLYAERCADGRHASWFDVERFERAAQLFGRYDQTLTNQLIKLLHEIERVQRLRGGEEVPPPVAAEVNVAVGDAGDGGSCSVMTDDRPNRTRRSASPSQRASFQAGQQPARETNQIGRKPLADKGMEGPSTPRMAASGPPMSRSGRDGARPSTRHENRTGPEPLCDEQVSAADGQAANGPADGMPSDDSDAKTPARETNQMDHNPLEYKGIQGATRPAVPRPAERRQDVFNSVRPRRRGQVFFQRKGAATAHNGVHH